MLIEKIHRLGALVAVSAASAFAACSSDPATGTAGAGAASSSAPSTASSSSAAEAVSASSGGPLTHTFMVSGVVDDGKDPVAGAIVMQGGAAMPAVTTGADGKYTIELTLDIPGTPAVVASKEGYRAAGVEFVELPTDPVELTLYIANPPDNEAYVYGDPGTGDATHDNSTLYCGHCHTTFVKQFQSSRHAQAAKDPWVQDLYAGVTEAAGDAASCALLGGTFRAGLAPGTANTAASKCYRGGGVLPDLNPSCAAGPLACDDPALGAAQKPMSFGQCADCHAPGIHGKAGGRSLLDATGIAYDDGNHCDVCHHVRDVDMTKAPGVAGRLVLQRPRETLSDMPGAKLRQVMFGPLVDVPNAFMGGSPQPKFKSAELCAGCHEMNQDALIPGTSLDDERWPTGLPVHSTYSEWQSSKFNAPDSQCQFCHMPPDDTGLTNSVDVTDPTNASVTFGFVRDPEDTRKHVFLEPLAGMPRLIDKAVDLQVSAKTNAGQIEVKVEVDNTLAGHAIPTGEPMRSLIVVVDGSACGAPLVPSDGMTLNDLGGSKAAGVAGADVVFAGTTLTWASGAARAKAGDVVRVVRPTGTFDDYFGVGFFADPMLTPAQKGLEIMTPVGEASVLSSGAGTVTVGASLPAQPGDRVYLGDPLPPSIADGDPSRALAGASGYVFAKALVDAAGARGVPHYRAVDIASDNRVPPGGVQRTKHDFAIPMSCASATVDVSLIYRPAPVNLAIERGWQARDYVIASKSSVVPLP